MGASLHEVKPYPEVSPQCPFCREVLPQFVEPSLKCSQCGTALHEICWVENSGQCTVFQCCGSQAPLEPQVTRGSIVLSTALLVLPVLLILTGSCPAWVFPAHTVGVIALGFFIYVLSGG